MSYHIEVILHWGHTTLGSNFTGSYQIEVILYRIIITFKTLYWGHTMLGSYCIKVMNHIKVILDWGHIAVRSYHIKVIMQWGHITLWSFCAEVISHYGHCALRSYHIEIMYWGHVTLRLSFKIHPHQLFLLQNNLSLSTKCSLFSSKGQSPW